MNRGKGTQRPLADPQQIGHLVAERVRRRRRHEVVGAQAAAGLKLEGAQDLVGRHARGAVEGLAALAGERQRVQLEAADARGVEGQRDQPPEIVVVVPARDHREQRRRDAVLVQQGQDALLARQEIAAQQGAVARAVQRVERQHDANPQPRQLGHQRFVGQKAQAVRRHGDPVNALLHAARDQTARSRDAWSARRRSG